MSQFCRRLRQSREIPDSLWSFVVLFAGFTITAFVNGSLYSFGVLLPSLMDYFQESRAKTATVGSLGTSIGYILSPVTALSSEHLGFRSTVMIFSTLSIVALVVSAFVPGLTYLYLTYGVLAGTGLSTCHNVAVVVVMKHFVKWTSFSSGVIQSAFGVGMLIVSQGTQKLIKMFGWRWALGGWAFMGFILFLCGCLFDGKEKAQVNEPYNIDQRRIATVITHASPKLLVLRNKLLLLYCTSFALCNMMFYVPIIYLVDFSEHHLGVSRDDSTALYAYFAIVIVFSRNLFCKLGSLRFFNRFYLYQASVALCGTVIVLLPFSKTYAHLVLFMLCMGLFDGGIWGLSALLVTDCAGVENMNFAWGIFNSVVAVASISGPPLAGLIADKSDSYIPAFYVSGATLIFASGLMFLRKWAKPRYTQHNHCRTLLTSSNNDDTLQIVERETVL